MQFKKMTKTEGHRNFIHF